MKSSSFSVLRLPARPWLCQFVFCLTWFAALGLSLSSGEASEERGVWWWTSPDHPWGTEQVIGNPDKESAALEFLKEWGINRLYGCYSKQTMARPAVVRDWNERVHAAGMSSQLLLSENTWIEPRNRANLLTVHIQRELIDFNADCANSTQRFDGLHLDIEPHGLPNWTSITPLERKRLLLQFRDTLREVREYLDAHGGKEIPVYADLPVWYDQVGKPVGWESDEERDACFADMAQSLAGISLMAYERDTASRIESGVIWELQNFKGEVRVGLEASVGPDKNKTWKSFNDLIAIIRAVEAATPTRKVDLHDFIQFHDLAVESAR
ncbi:hypothetical protein Q31b_58720 [Novipirellula aureliae]|uniref:Glycosyl hydrolase-like 10 domain-containing protein n=1 Tax=Novipirellula aureliae TaxID=2527966 RepID=A0A5C6D3C5_9BACT|nr:hypothetical protein [Novipirellula aureliae]TWU31703.1 hypothetical protein Q31b_58720 [Novipirellula aureliae]